MPETQQRMNALTQVRKALEHWGLQVEDIQDVDGDALQFTGLRYEGESDVDYVVKVTPVKVELTEAERRERSVVGSLISTDGEVKKIENGVVYFGAWNGMCAERIKNRARYQLEDVTWGPKFTGQVTL